MNAQYALIEEDTVAAIAVPVNKMADYDLLLEKAARKNLVLIGEASHGTHEFYETRANLTKRLIEEKGFRMVVLEADWPDALRVHRYVTGESKEASPEEALGDFQRFPSWMWRNDVMVDFVGWLHKRNKNKVAGDTNVGLFGLDMYSMHASIQAVVDYLRAVDERAAVRAEKRYTCFDAFGEDPQRYGLLTSVGIPNCEEQVMEQILDLRQTYRLLVDKSENKDWARNEFFYAEQNARLVHDAERYYRQMFQGRDASWNLRDAHMLETIKSLIAHFYPNGNKMVVWAHNSHLGDARATDMKERGEWNVGQLLRERFPDQVFSIGFSTYSGTVTAASDWGAVAETKRVIPGLPDSYEALFHATGVPEFWLDLHTEDEDVKSLLEKPRLQRAIGVIYRPETERDSHYGLTCLPKQFDAMIHLDATRAVKPLARTSVMTEGELPETYPEGL